MRLVSETEARRAIRHAQAKAHLEIAIAMLLAVVIISAGWFLLGGKERMEQMEKMQQEQV